MNDQKDKLWPMLQKLGQPYEEYSAGETTAFLTRHISPVVSPGSFTESQVRFSECGGACSAFLLLIGLVAWWLVGERGVVWSWGSWFAGFWQHQCLSALSEVLLSCSPVVAARGVSLVVDPSVRFSVFPGGSALVSELVWVA
ncbi:hypothetical protein HID58_057706 [Brassica napus]|uniref:Uncharacterized protein n=1 Tax=Brassica napus TaxID=3708 RepID=A0ABQ8ARY5_BRANA|nr:hypothetical protein HID58_057706 [Brassica napus]